MRATEAVDEGEEREEKETDESEALVAVYCTEAAGDENEGTLGQAEGVSEFGAVALVYLAEGAVGGWQCFEMNGKTTYEYAAAIQLACPGPTSCPNALLTAIPPATVVNAEVN